MADMLPPYTIGDVLHDVGSALGVAARTIVETSATPIGTLAVKTADLTIDFDIMSSQLTDTAETGLRIRPGTLSVSNDTEHTTNRWSNHSTLRLQIVSVLPDGEPAAAPMLPPSTPAHPNPVVATIDTLAADSAAMLPLLRIAVDELLRRLHDEVKLPPDAAKVAAADLAQIRATVDRGEAELARKLLSVFGHDYPQFRIQH